MDSLEHIIVTTFSLERTGICIWMAWPSLHGHVYGNDVIMLMSEGGQEHATHPKNPAEGG